MSVDDKNDQSVMISLDTLLSTNPMLSDLNKDSDVSNNAPNNVDLSALDQVGLGAGYHNRAAPLTTAAMPVIQQLDIKPKKINGFLKFILMTLGIGGLVGGGIYLGTFLQPKKPKKELTSTQIALNENTVVQTNLNTTPTPPPKKELAVTATSTKITTETTNPTTPDVTEKTKTRSKTKSNKTKRRKYRNKTKTKTKKEPDTKPEPQKKAPTPTPKKRSEANDILKNLKNKKGGGSSSNGTSANSNANNGLPSRLSKDNILSTVRKNQRSVNACKKLVQEKTRVSIRMIINKSGKVSSASLLKPANLQGSPLDKCMVSRVSRFVFPKFNGPDMSIKLPFIL
jgi:outer membrane biosynthesis protein TonB